MPRGHGLSLVPSLEQSSTYNLVSRTKMIERLALSRRYQFSHQLIIGLKRRKDGESSGSFLLWTGKILVGQR